MRIAVLASGTGSLLEFLLSARDGGDSLPVDLVLVDRPCPAEEVAAANGVACQLVERSSFGADFDRVSYTQQVVALLQDADIALVVMAGWGTVFERQIFDAFPGAIINTHPALLPSFKGWHAVREALDYGVKITGCTVHVATLEVDSGPILAQAAVEVLPGDDESTLHERIKVVERTIYRDTIQQILQRGTVLP